VLRILFPPSPVPPEHRRNFTHLYFDIGWYGILAGSALNFQSVYAARLGASAIQIGLMSAIPAVVSLMLAIPSGAWLEKHPVGRAVFRTSVIYRLGFLFWIFLPWLFDESGQVWGLTTLILLQAIPLTALAVGFNALFAIAVPANFRAQVAGTRNVVLSVTFMSASLGCGYLLDRIAFPLGYQVVFAIGFLGAVMSSLHLFFVRPVGGDGDGVPAPRPAVQAPAAGAGDRIRAALRLDIWRTPFRNSMLVMLGFHLAQYLSIPLFPLYFVNELHLGDEQIGTGTALFYLSVLLASTQLGRISRRLSQHRISGLGAIGMCLYPILLALSRNALEYYILSAVGGLTWAMIGGAYANYLLEKIPAGDRPAHLAWYNIILNTAILAGSLAGPLMAGAIGLDAALLIIGLMRLASGFAILKWG